MLRTSLDQNNVLGLATLVMLICILLVTTLLMLGKFETFRINSFRGHVFVLTFSSFCYYGLVKVSFGLDLSNVRITAVSVLALGFILALAAAVYRRLVRVEGYVTRSA